MFPEGCLWHDGSLYVAAPPEIWKFTDADDDGHAEKREVWFDGTTLTGCGNDLHGPIRADYGRDPIRRRVRLPNRSTMSSTDQSL